jgi:hypothetical protein
MYRENLLINNALSMLYVASIMECRFWWTKNIPPLVQS